jgi:hypothetical protein
MKIQIDKEVKTPKQYSKCWMTRWQIFCMIWISIYLTIDCIYNKGANVNNIVVLLISSIIASLIPYFAKSFLETKEDKKMQLEQLKLQSQTEFTNFGADNTELEEPEEVG